MEDEPAVARPLADAAVRDDVLVARHALRGVELLELLAALERAVLADRLRPRDARRTRDMPAALRGLAHSGRRDDLAVELGRAPDVDEDELRVVEPGQDVVAERAEAVVALRELVVRRGVAGHVGRQRQPIVEPELAAAVEDPHVAMAVEL